MNNINASSLFQKNMTTLNVTFEFDVKDFVSINAPDKPKRFFGSEYTFKVDKALGVGVGDLVAVHATDTIKVAVVSSIDETPNIDYNASYRYKWVVSKIDLSAYKASMKAEAAFDEALRQSEKKRIENELIEMMTGEHGEDFLESDAVKQLEGK